MQYADAAIAGAGIIGLATALELASAGMNVVVFERGSAMRECSWAAAGMLAASDPENPPELRALSNLSASLYPEFLARVEHLSGNSVPLRTSQTLQSAHALSPHLRVLHRDAVQRIVPGLRHDLDCFLIDEYSLDPRDLAVALPAAARAAGVTILEQTSVLSTRSLAGSVHISTSRAEWRTAHFINACGAWASQLTSFPIVPRKGHILLVDLPEPQLAVSVRTPDLYLVPRGDGRIIIGATVEDTGFDTHIDARTVDTLFAAAKELWPPMHNARILDTWTGLRPASADLLPVIGNHGPNSWLSLGHFRNGILLAPASARLLRRMILSEPIDADLHSYSPDRFALAAANR